MTTGVKITTRQKKQNNICTAPAEKADLHCTAFTVLIRYSECNFVYYLVLCVAHQIEVTFKNDDTVLLEYLEIIICIQFNDVGI